MYFNCQMCINKYFNFFSVGIPSCYHNISGHYSKMPLNSFLHVVYFFIILASVVYFYAI
jgi:hypothetical protein